MSKMMVVSKNPESKIPHKYSEEYAKNRTKKVCWNHASCGAAGKNVWKLLNIGLHSCVRCTDYIDLDGFKNIAYGKQAKWVYRDPLDYDSTDDEMVYVDKSVEATVESNNREKTINSKWNPTVRRMQDDFDYCSSSSDEEFADCVQKKANECQCCREKVKYLWKRKYDVLCLSCWTSYTETGRMPKPGVSKDSMIMAVLAISASFMLAFLAAQFPVICTLFVLSASLCFFSAIVMFKRYMLELEESRRR